MSKELIIKDNFLTHHFSLSTKIAIPETLSLMTIKPVPNINQPVSNIELIV